VIAVDWGTSNFRAFRLDNAGHVLERRAYPTGILHIEGRRYAETFEAHIGDWLAAGENKVLLCGMVGSREGWTEARYLPCPVTIQDLAAAAVQVPFLRATAMLIPGVMGNDRHGNPEVMRGEETEAMGAMELCQGTGTVCLPGTHSKWIQLRDYAIERFQTCMTGDVFAALRRHTILSRTMVNDSPVVDEAFLRGVQRSADSGGLLHHLFSVRTLGLFDQLRKETSASYLSGLLIGHEVRSMLQPAESVYLVGAAPLCRLYALAIDQCGGRSILADEDAAARGLAAIAQQVTWP
jgi:2-dehydro-3-deoxygalactonokinase